MTPGQPGPIHMAMHFGSVDLSAIYGARVGPLPLTGPMEFVEAPLARAYFDRVRNDLDVTIVPLDNAAEALTGALERGEAVGIVADRNIVGRGTLVELFGGPMRLPIGPAMLSSLAASSSAAGASMGSGCKPVQPASSMTTATSRPNKINGLFSFIFFCTRIFFSFF